MKKRIGGVFCQASFILCRKVLDIRDKEKQRTS